MATLVSLVASALTLIKLVLAGIGAKRLRESGKLEVVNTALLDLVDLVGKANAVEDALLNSTDPDWAARVHKRARAGAPKD
jgi:hypothetical protein